MDGSPRPLIKLAGALRCLPRTGTFAAPCRLYLLPPIAPCTRFLQPLRGVVHWHPTLAHAACMCTSLHSPCSPPPPPDFGFSKDENVHSAPTSYVGTPQYLAPEVPSCLSYCRCCLPLLHLPTPAAAATAHVACDLFATQAAATASITSAACRSLLTVRGRHTTCKRQTSGPAEYPSLSC